MFSIFEQIFSKLSSIFNMQTLFVISLPLVSVFFCFEVYILHYCNQMCCLVSLFTVFFYLCQSSLSTS